MIMMDGDEIQRLNRGNDLERRCDLNESRTFQSLLTGYS